MALGFELKEYVKKRKGGQISPLYGSECENSLVVRLKPFAINGLDRLRVSTAEIKCPFEI